MGNSGGGKIDRRVIFVAIPALIILAFSLGLLVLGPMLKSYNGSNTEITGNQIPSSPVPHAAPAPKKEDPKLDVEITESKSQQTDDTGVKKDDNGLTVTLEPDKKPSTDSTDTSDDTSVQTDKPETKTVDKPKPPIQETKPSTPVEKSRAAVSAPTEKGRFRVQAGTYANKESADRLAAALADRGYRSEVKMVQMEDRTLYRVQVGEYKSRSSADVVVDKLKADGYTPSISH